jgi:hypothetical protein
VAYTNNNYIDVCATTSTVKGKETIEKNGKAVTRDKLSFKIDERITANNAIKNAPELIAKSLVDCTPESLKPETSEDAKEVVAAMAKGYNCLQDRKRSGALGVSVCNASSASSINGKGSMWNDLANKFGSAIGASKAARQ